LVVYFLMGHCLSQLSQTLWPTAESFNNWLS
jgi:hypothetical protein